MTVVKLKKTQGLNETETLVHLDNSHSRPLKVYGEIGGGSGDFDLKGLIERTITEVVIPDDITSIGRYAFNGCSSLTSIELPNVTSIGGYAFYECSSLTSIELPNVTSLGEAAFYECSSLTSVTINNVTPPTLGASDVFADCHENLKIYVPSSAVDTYKAATGWSTYADKIEAIQE